MAAADGEVGLNISSILTAMLSTFIFERNHNILLRNVTMREQ